MLFKRSMNQNKKKLPKRKQNLKYFYCYITAPLTSICFAHSERGEVVFTFGEQAVRSLIEMVIILDESSRITSKLKIYNERKTMGLFVSMIAFLLWYVTLLFKASERSFHSGRRKHLHHEDQGWDH